MTRVKARSSSTRRIASSWMESFAAGLLRSV